MKPVVDTGEVTECVVRGFFFFFFAGESAAAAGLRCGTKEIRVQHEP